MKLSLVILAVMLTLTGCATDQSRYNKTHQLQLLSVKPGIIGSDIHGLEFQVFNSTDYLVDELTIKVLCSDQDQYFAVPIVIQPYLEPGEIGIFYLDSDLRYLSRVISYPLAGYLESARRTWYASTVWNDRQAVLATALYRNWFEIAAYRHRGPASD